MTAGQVSDYTAAAALLGTLAAAEWLVTDPGYDADVFREAVKDRGLRPSIPGRKLRGKAVRYDSRRYKRRNRIEIMFGRLKDWRASQPGTTIARSCAFRPAPWPRPSHPGGESRVQMSSPDSCTRATLWGIGCGEPRHQMACQPQPR